MFDQDDTQQMNNTQADYSQIFDTSVAAPAPGSPVGPLSQDSVQGHAPPSSPVVDDAPLPEFAADNNQAAPTQEPPSQGDEELLGIKQNALHELAPLVGQLEQSPEEKFRTTMMMIQASDDQTLVKVAYDAAKQITDEKVRAQALLDVVNEINYFTQQNNQSAN